MNTDLPVLIVSTKVDVATDSVARILGDLHVPFFRLNTEDFPYRTSSTYQTGQNRVAFQGMSGPFRSIWWRRLRSPETPEDMNDGVHDYCVREGRDFLAGIVLASQCRIMSRPSSVWAAEHKLYQLKIAEDCGLKIPRTVATNSPTEIRNTFAAFDGQMIAKPVRSGYVDLRDGSQRSIFTTKITEDMLEDLSGAKWTPAIFQELIPKALDVRITVVGKQIFPAAIESLTDPAAVVDWRRTENPDLPHSKLELPVELEAKIRLLMQRLDLSFGALDFVLTPDDEYIFLEVNPSGQWLWLDDRLDLGITSAVATWLSTGEEA